MGTSVSPWAEADAGKYAGGEAGKYEAVREAQSLRRLVAALESGLAAPAAEAAAMSAAAAAAVAEAAKTAAAGLTAAAFPTMIRLNNGAGILGIRWGAVQAAEAHTCPLLSLT